MALEPSSRTSSCAKEPQGDTLFQSTVQVTLCQAQPPAHLLSVGVSGVT